MTRLTTLAHPDVNAFSHVRVVRVKSTIIHYNDDILVDFFIDACIQRHRCFPRVNKTKVKQDAYISVVFASRIRELELQKGGISALLQTAS